MSLLAQSRIAAFFDIDGTLIPNPSLELRFFAWLVRSGRVPTRNYLGWLAQAARLAPQGSAMCHANKMYLRGISHRELLSEVARDRRGMSSPRFLPDALHRLMWHAHRGHQIFLITGTLEPLAREIAEALTALLAIRGIPVSLGVRATQLQERNGRWTGQVLGAPIFGGAKADAVRQLASKMFLDLPRSYAYADRFTDRHMLEAVGQSFTVNPSPRLRRLAHRRRWAILHWLPKAESLPSTQPSTKPCSSGLQFRPEAFREHEQDSTLEKVV